MPIATCHCGAVRLSFPMLDRESARRCDCSYCRRRGTLVVSVPAPELTVEKGETLRRYVFNTHTAQHFFCETCGIHTHHRRRSNPDEFGVNVACLEDVDIRRVDWTWADGVHHPSDS